MSDIEKKEKEKGQGNCNIHWQSEKKMQESEYDTRGYNGNVWHRCTQSSKSCPIEGCEAMQFIDVI